MEDVIIVTEPTVIPIYVKIIIELIEVRRSKEGNTEPLNPFFNIVENEEIPLKIIAKNT